MGVKGKVPVHTMKAYMESRGITPHIPNLDITR
jgi:hypothetical protein